MLPLEQTPLATILAEAIDKEIGGKVYGNQLVRKGAKYIQVKTYDAPEAVDSNILYTVQFTAPVFIPICGSAAVYQMKVVAHRKDANEVECIWPDPVTGLTTAKAIIEVPAETAATALPPVNSLINVHLVDFAFEYDQDHVKCVGRAAASA